MPARLTPPYLPEIVHRGGRSFTRPELARLATEARSRRAIAEHEVVPILPGHYGSVAHLYSLAVRAHAACTATRGVLSGSGALHLARALDRPPPTLLVATPHGCTVVRPDWLDTFAPAKRPTPLWAGALPFTEPALACVHAWSRGDPQRSTGDILTTLQRRVTTTAAVRAVAEAAPRVRDRRGLEHVLAAFDAGAHSFLEYTGLTRVFVGREFAQLLRQHTVVARGRRRHLDTYDPSTRTAFELDGGEFHLPGEQREQDNRRDSDLATLGILTVRFGYRDVMDRPDWCRETARAVLRARSEGLRRG